MNAACVVCVLYNNNELPKNFFCCDGQIPRPNSTTLPELFSLTQKAGEKIKMRRRRRRRRRVEERFNTRREEEEEDLFTLSVVYSPEERERETIQTKQRSNVLRERERETAFCTSLLSARVVRACACACASSGVNCLNKTRRRKKKS